MRKCKLADFCFSKTDEECTDKDRKKYFSDWTGFSTICVPVSVSVRGQRPRRLQGSEAQRRSRLHDFKKDHLPNSDVRLYDPAKRIEGVDAPCKPEDEIKSYAKRMI